jgi:hypothetical protein
MTVDLRVGLKVGRVDMDGEGVFFFFDFFFPFPLFPFPLLPFSFPIPIPLLPFSFPIPLLPFPIVVFSLVVVPMVLISFSLFPLDSPPLLLLLSSTDPLIDFILVSYISSSLLISRLEGLRFFRPRV